MSRGFLKDLGDLEEEERLEDCADVVIVGSGAAGATAARVLSGHGIEVVVLEAGPHLSTSDFRPDLFSSFKAMWPQMGMQVAEGRAFTALLQGRCVGGTTVVNAAIVHRMPEKIFDLWQREHGVEAPVTFEALSRAWDQLEAELEIAPTPEEVLGNVNQRMRLGTQRLGIDGNVIRRNVSGCRGSARCLQGCPTGAKQSMDRTYIPRSIAQGARVYATCRAERILHEKGRVTGVRGRFLDPRTRKKGPEILVHARHAVIVAASAIQTPILLRDSGIGKASGLVGERFQAHPGTAVMGVFDEPIEMWFGATQGFESTHYWHERMKFETISLPPELGAVRLPGYGRTLMARLADYGHYALFAVQIRARAHGRVRRSWTGRPVVRYDLTDDDVRILKLGVKRLTEMMFAAGAKAIFPGVHGLPDRVTAPEEVIGRLDRLPDDPRLFHCIVSHLFGTATMGGDPRRSVVGSEGQSHELSGLYVTDASVFPTNLGVNPQHTICGLSWVMAERLAERVLAK